MPIRRKGLIVGALPVLALLVNSILLAAVTQQQQTLTREVTRSVEVRTASRELLEILLDAETSVRGFLAAGVEEFLEPYDAALPRLEVLLRTYAALAAAPSLRDHAEAIISLSSSVLSQLAGLRASPPASASELNLALNEQKSTMDALRAELRAVIEAETTTIDAKLRESRDLARLAMTVVIAGLGVGLLGGGVATLLFTTGVVRRIDRLRENARRLEQGFEQLDPPPGDDELGVLGRALAEAGDLLASRAQEALAASRMKSEFLATMSHEIRTPLNGVVGMSQLLLDTELTGEQREFAEAASRSAEVLLGVINDILDFSKIEAGHMDLDAVDFDVRDTVEEAVALLADRAHDEQLELVTSFEADVPAELRGDAGRFRQVMLNLVGNAIKFTAHGEVVVHVAAGQGSTTALRVEVRDTGMGIPTELHDRLFASFVQADASTTRTHGGSGLGLAISKQLVELMGGRIGVDSRPGVGSTFWFTVQFAAPAAATRGDNGATSLAGTRALVVDDNDTNLRILTHLLARWRIDAVPAASAADALDLLGRSAPFDVAILDYHMPHTDGLELADQIVARGHLPSRRLVLLTSSGLGEDRRRARTAQLGGYLTKPVRQSSLHDCLADLLGQPGPPEPEPEPGTPATVAATAVTGRRILLVEDNAVNQQVARRMLQRHGHTVDVAADGQAAVDATARTRYDAILMDCQLPILDGYAATRVIRSNEKPGQRTPIIALTASAMVGDAEACFAAGMDDYIAKPVRGDELNTTLTRWLGPPAIPAAHPPDHSPPATAEFDERIIAELRELNEPAGDISTLIARFFTSGPARLQQLRDAFEADDDATVNAIAHDLKGSSGSLGATRFAELLREFEEAVRRGDRPAAAAHLLDAEHALPHVCAALAHYFPSPP